MIIGAAPTRDRLEEVCEKKRDCFNAGFVNAGTRNSGMVTVLLRAMVLLINVLKLERLLKL